MTHSGSETTFPPSPFPTGTSPAAPAPGLPQQGRSPDSLADVLERVLDKGIVIVGDIQVRLLDIELLTIKLRLLVASVERAREMGITWWEGDAFAMGRLEDGEEGNGNGAWLASRVDSLEGRIAELSGDGSGQSAAAGQESRDGRP